MLINEDFFDDSEIEVNLDDNDIYKHSDEYYKYDFMIYYSGADDNHIRKYNLSKKTIKIMEKQLQNILFVSELVVESDDESHCHHIKFNTSYTLENNQKHISYIINFLYIIIMFNCTIDSGIILKNNKTESIISLKPLTEYFMQIRDINSRRGYYIGERINARGIKDIMSIINLFFGIDMNNSNNIVLLFPCYINDNIYNLMRKIKFLKDFKETFNKSIMLNTCLVNKDAFRTLLDNPEPYNNVEIQFISQPMFKKVQNNQLTLFSIQDLNDSSQYVRNDEQKKDIINMLHNVNNFHIYPIYTIGGINEQTNQTSVVILFQKGIVEESVICYFIQISGIFEDVENTIKKLFKVHGQVFF